MKAFCIVEKGIESTCIKEIKELIGKTAKPEDSCVTFSCKDEGELAKFTYLTQSANRVLELISVFEVKPKLEPTTKSIAKALDKSFSLKGKTIRVDCERKGEHDFNSMDLEKQTGEILIKEGKAKGASMSKPDVIMMLYIVENKGYLGIDVSGRDLGKRNYKIFQAPGTIRGPIGYALLRIAGYKPGMSLLDPFCGSGTIPIEAALYATNTSPHYFDKQFRFSRDKNFESLDKRRKDAEGIVGMDRELRHVNNTRKNAKIAGIEKSIKITKCDVEWLDTQMDKSSVDHIITNPPQDSKRTDERELVKTYDEFFYQAEFILKKQGIITILCIKPELLVEIAKKRGFNAETQSIYSGKQEYQVIRFKRVM